VPAAGHVVPVGRGSKPVVKTPALPELERTVRESVWDEQLRAPAEVGGGYER